MEYIVEMANSEQDERRQVYQGPASECVVNNLLPGRTYCFWIRAANKVGVTTVLMRLIFIFLFFYTRDSNDTIVLQD